ncbi:copper amine oxidase N-terminal domain-containing protein [Cohnella luojiensis]|uniref:Copper amine oxidase N-terminal domain-containing protein n=1 Tax=Cohnella luojiensis TaxID=652876 RepID=A0A4Y8LS39_9BACL|nr:copper amine oxidase N-terminal domain-containing protein [Cohnella luojiensis]TFE23663.1 copper amine oxidase N-terminal domain-containing protein [Cohnella luojiensis]
MKRLISLLACIVLAFSLAGTASAAAAEAGKSSTVKVVVYGKAVDFKTGLLVQKGKVFVEYEVLFNQLGYETQFDPTTKSFLATGEDFQIEAAIGADMSFVNGEMVQSTGEIIEHNGQTMVGVRFAGLLTNHKVTWNGKSKSISIVYQGPTPEQRAAVYELFNKLLLIEAADDKAGFKALLSDDALLNIEEAEENWNSTKTKTVIEGKYIESYSDTAAVAVLVEDTKKVSGDFFPDNKSQSRYTLHKAKDGSWKIYNVEVLAMEYTNIPGLFEQSVAVPDAEKSAIGQVFADQIKAANEKNVEAYAATLVDFPDKEVLKKSLEEFFKTSVMTVTADQWTIVEYDGTNKAILLASTTTEVEANGQKSKLKSVLLNEVNKVDGKWLLQAEAVILSNEPV